MSRAACQRRRGMPVRPGRCSRGVGATWVYLPASVLVE
jgi:hypothetical protein